MTQTYYVIMYINTMTDTVDLHCTCKIDCHSSHQSSNKDSKDGPLFSVDKFSDLPLSAHMVSEKSKMLF